MMRNRQLWNVSWDDYRRHLNMQFDALNFALKGLPEDRIRFHVCWGNFEGPHQNDVALADIVDHPRLVARRLVRFAELVGRENVIAAPDCGFGTFVFRLASDRLF